jgi:hypothetical protein
MKSVVIKASTKPDKKLMAVFTRDNRKKTIHFGAKNMDDYTKTKDKAQRKRYLDRHRKNENWSNPESAGALSRWILWGNSTSRRENISRFKKRFGYS